MKKMTHHLTLVSLGLALCFGSANLWAQSAANYPDKPVKVIIPFPPGGTLDKIGRMLALKMGEQLGQNFVVENRPGGNGIIGADVVESPTLTVIPCCSMPVLL
jgi:tripartite-type tricarboxylate transporter receptor subunit TctC